MSAWTDLGYERRPRPVRRTTRRMRFLLGYWDAVHDVAAGYPRVPTEEPAGGFGYVARDVDPVYYAGYTGALARARATQGQPPAQADALAAYREYLRGIFGASIEDREGVLRHVNRNRRPRR